MNHAQSQRSSSEAMLTGQVAPTQGVLENDQTGSTPIEISPKDSVIPREKPLEGATFSSLDHKSTQNSESDVSSDSETIVKAVSVPEPARSLPWAMWLVEIILCVVSLCSFITIIVVLSKYDGTPVLRLPFNITLNAFLSFLASLTKAAFMVPIAEAISQWKWNSQKLYGAGRPISDFEVIDKASRGTIGSLSLMKHFKLKHVTIIGAFVTIMGIATSPITQQMIDYPLQRAPEDVLVQVPYAKELTLHAPDENFPDSLLKAIDVSLYSDVDDPEDYVKPLCPSGNCTFEPYQSLGVCSRIADISHLLTVTAMPNSTSADWTFVGDSTPRTVLNDIKPNGTTSFNATLPNGINLITPVSYAIARFMANVTDTLAFADDQDGLNFTAISRMYIIYSNAGNISSSSFIWPRDTAWEFHAVEILYYICVNTYVTSVTSGNPTTDIIASSNKPFLVDDNEPLPIVPCSELATFSWYCPIDRNSTRVTYLADPSDPDSKDISKAYSIPWSTATELQSHFAERIGELLYWDGGYQRPLFYIGAPALTLLDAAYGATFNITDPVAQEARLGITANNTAISLTNLVRTLPGNFYQKGTSWISEPFVHIKWGFLVFLGIQLVIAYLFLAITIFVAHKRRAPIIKSSALATMLVSSQEMRSAIGTVYDLNQAEKQATTIMIRLADGKLEII